MSPLTTDPKEARESAILPNGQQEVYVVLSEEERAKGFVRPVRRAYVHVGRTPAHPLTDLTPEEAARHGTGYVKYESYEGCTVHDHGSIVGQAWKQDQLKGGCGAVTTMALALAETYARQPDFYGATFCASCGAHFPVGERGEFVWDGTTEKVGT